MPSVPVMLLFQTTDIPRILPEILLTVLALLVLGSDIFEHWANDEEAQRERIYSSASLTVIGLGLIFLITLLQSGYIYKLPPEANSTTLPLNFFINVLRNLQSGGPASGHTLLGAFANDDLTMIARLIFLGAAFLTTLLTVDFRPTNAPGEFYTLLLFSTLGMCLMAASSEFILAFLAIELTSIPLYVLAGYFQKQTKTAAEAGMKYLLFGATSSAVLLYGISLVYGFTANALPKAENVNDLTQFARIAQIAMGNGGNSSLLTLGMIFIIAGIGYKVAVVPFHSWSPDVYQGATAPITAFISTASKAAGFVLLYRVLTEAFPSLVGSASLALTTNFGGWTSLLALIAFLTLIWGNLAALPQTNTKRLLAYSSIAHAGFLLMGIIAWATIQPAYRTMGISSLLYYLIVYVATNIGAFGALGVVSLAVGGDDIEDLNGLAQRNLGLAVLLAVFILSLAGIPPLAGFFAKFYIFMAAWQADATWLVIVGVATTIISLYYYLCLLKAIFILQPSSSEPVKIPFSMGLTLVISVILVFLLGIYPNVILPIVDKVQVTAGL